MDEKPTILIIDDEIKILEIVKTFLESKGYNVLCAITGEDGLAQFYNFSPVLIFLDLMLPGISGEQVCQKIRETSSVPIIMLTAKVSEEDLVSGLDYGADDYITKPFGLKELYARMEAVLRRTSNKSPLFYQKNINGLSDLMVDLENRLVFKQSNPVNLTPNEFKLFATLFKYPNKTFTRQELIEFSLGDDFEGFDRAVDSHIKNIRQKIEADPRNPSYIITVHGIGYKFGGH